MRPVFPAPNLCKKRLEGERKACSRYLASQVMFHAATGGRRRRQLESQRKCGKDQHPSFREMKKSGMKSSEKETS